MNYFISLSLLSFLSLSVNAHRNFSVIIVGAGPSGIAAATRLLKNGVENLVVLEAEDRIGGRVNSVIFGDSYVDIGAEFCHGQGGNIVYEMVQKYNILQPGSKYSEMLYSNGKKVEDALAEEITGFEGIYQGLDRSETDYYATISDFFTRKYNEMILQKYKSDTEKLKICRDALGTLRSTVCGHKGAFDWSKPALNSPYKSCEGDQAMTWHGLGYKAILDIMMQKYPDPKNVLPLDDKIRLNKVVTNVAWNSESKKVSLTCSDGSQYAADHVIFTPSLGVLKKKYQELFKPELPREKEDCIKALGFDAIMKVHLHFPERWWSGDFVDRIFVWSEEDKETLVEQFPHGPNINGSSWLEGVCHISPAASNPNVLVLWITGEGLPELEVGSNETIKEGLMFAISKFLGNEYNITQPDAMLHSTWYNHPNFHGTYSYQTVEALKLGYNCFDELAQTLYDSEGEPRLFFAGEATNTLHSSTVHGAIETGYREADKILLHYQTD